MSIQLYEPKRELKKLIKIEHIRDFSIDDGNNIEDVMGELNHILESNKTKYTRIYFDVEYGNEYHHINILGERFETVNEYKDRRMNEEKAYENYLKQKEDYDRKLYNKLKEKFEKG